MKKFIDLTNQINQGEKCFAWYDTVINEFEIHDGVSTWTWWSEFESNDQGTDLPRYKPLCPASFVGNSQMKTLRNRYIFSLRTHNISQNYEICSAADGSVNFISEDFPNRPHYMKNYSTALELVGAALKEVEGLILVSISPIESNLLPQS